MKTLKSILIVEDDMVDAMTIKRALKELRVTNKTVVTENGEKALEYLRSGEEGKPCIILLDLNMPKMNGIEFLRTVKADDEFKTIPVVVLTTSHDEKDRLESFQQSVAGYMLKPVDYKQFVETVKTINLYWSLSELPQ